MTSKDIGHNRLYSQRISCTKFTTPVETVKWLGCVQAQDYLAALWAVGLRTQNANETDVERAFINKSVVRTWSLRGTLHFVSSDDVHWMLDLIAPRLRVAHATRLLKDYELNEKVLTHCKKVLMRALQNEKQLSRDAIYSLLESAAIPVKNQRGLHILWRLAQDKLICFGVRQGKQQTFVLLDEWIPKTHSLNHDEALAKLASRYFASHGPATLQDFTWWSGLAPMDAKTGFESIKSQLINEKVAEQIYWMSANTQSIHLPSIQLLPSFDEYLISYSNRDALFKDHNFGKLVMTKNGIFNPVIVVNGQVTGIWKRTLKKNLVEITVKPFTTFSTTQRKVIGIAAKQYGTYLNMEVICKF